MQHEHTEHVAAPPDRVYAALADVSNLPHYVPQVTAARQLEGGAVEIEARYGGHDQRGQAWFRTDDERRRVEWGAEGSDYSGYLQVDADGEASLLRLALKTSRGDASDAEVMGTLDAIRRLVEADV
jgi:carbon monoxide dehydrogenase subunit G